MPHGRALFLDFNPATLGSWFVYLDEEQAEALVGRASWNVSSLLVQAL